MDFKSLYQARFNDNTAKNKIWKVLCKNFFQKYIDKNSVVVDIAAGYCEFINNIQAKTKIAVDLNPDTASKANSDVTCINKSCESIDEFIDASSVDVVFVSNFFEHLDSKDQIVKIFSGLHKILRKRGKVLVIQPNIRYVKADYWDFIDHKLALTDLSLIEAAEMNGFKPVKRISKFLPYTTKSKIPQSPFLVFLYLKFMPLSGIFMGKQSFLVLEKINE